MNTRNDAFPPTRWTMIQRVGAEDPEQKREALESFCRAYWFPLYHFARMQGRGAHDAEDSIQGFFQQLLSRLETFDGLDPMRGKLRSWLLKSFRNYMHNEWERDTAEKRGGGAEIVALDLDGAEERVSLEMDADPDAVFDRSWAETVLTHARHKLKIAHAEAGKADFYAALKPFLTKGTPEHLIGEVAAKLGKSEGAIRMAVSRLRDDYRVAIRNEIADTMGSEEDIEGEIRYLLSCLR